MGDPDAETHECPLPSPVGAGVGSLWLCDECGAVWDLTAPLRWTQRTA